MQLDHHQVTRLRHGDVASIAAKNAPAIEQIHGAPAQILKETETEINHLQNERKKMIATGSSADKVLRKEYNLHFHVSQVY